MPLFKKKIVKIGLPVLGVLGIAAVYLLRPINTDDTLVKVDEVLAKGKRDFLAQPDSNTNHAKPNVIILLADDLGSTIFLCTVARPLLPQRLIPWRLRALRSPMAMCLHRLLAFTGRFAHRQVPTAFWA
jgi:hypothetical protein